MVWLKRSWPLPTTPAADDAVGARRGWAHSIRCGDATHRLRLTPRGRLGLLDHPRLTAERAMVALGGQSSTCLRVLELYSRPPTSLNTSMSRTAKLSQLAPGLNDLAAATQATRSRLWAAQAWTDPLVRPAARSADERLQQWIGWALVRCNYWLPRGLVGWDIALEAVTWDGVPSITLAWGPPRGSVRLRRSWREVWRQGLAVVRGRSNDEVFVFEVIEAGPSPLVLAGYQHFDDRRVTAELARVTANGRLEWLGP